MPDDTHFAHQRFFWSLVDTLAMNKNKAQRNPDFSNGNANWLKKKKSVVKAKFQS